MAPPTDSRSAAGATEDAHQLAIGTLQASLDVFNGPPSTTVTSGGRQQLRDLVEKHKQTAAKAALLATSSGPSAGSALPPEVASVLYSLEQSTIGLVSYCHGFTADAGPSLTASLKGLCEGVVGPTQDLVKQLAAGDAVGLRRTVGLVWGACDEVAKGPLDNKGCLFRQLADVMSGIKGAVKELDDLVEESRQEMAAAPAHAAAEAPANGHVGHSGRSSRQNGSSEATEDGEAPEDGAEGTAGARGADVEGGEADPHDHQHGGSSSGGGDGDGDGDDEEDEAGAEEDGDSDDFRDMGTLAAGELRTAEAAAALLGAAQGALRTISRPLLEGPPVGSSHCLDDWESMAWHAGKLRSGCEALVACLYPPHDDPEELQGSADSIATTLELMLAEFPEAYLEGPPGAGEGEGAGAGAGGRGGIAQQLEAAQREVDVAAERLRDALSRAARVSGAGGGGGGV